ncbi:MAG: methionyl-tRNA formyltransferase [Lachnospiraceae bacterium]|nr:methionyl-tRNA formyltransferase [Lachnospiraceae bacterium]
MKLIFMGTPDFAAKILEALVKGGHEIVLAVTQPDRPKGRKGEPAFSDVKQCALRYGIPVYQPLKLRAPEALEELEKFDADAVVVAAFGQILPKSVLELTEGGCINVHASLLPKYRGASPIQQAILKGEEKTGVTIMQMDEGIDTGDILLQREVPIGREDTGGSLFEKLARAGGELILEALRKLGDGALKPVPQEEEKSSYASMITKKQGLADFGKPALVLERMVRAFDPWPGTYTYYNGKMLKIWKASAKEGREAAPGQILQAGKDGIEVSCKEGILVIRELQLEGKKRMNADEFLRGCRMEEGQRLGGGD